MFSWIRQQPVMVAIVFDPEHGYFLAFNEKWQSYAFPMQKPRPGDLRPETAAIRAVEESVGHGLRHATAEPLFFEQLEGVSGRTNKRTRYFYQAFLVDPGEPLPSGGFGRSYGWLLEPDLLTADRVTWSTKRLMTTFLKEQEVVVAVITRRTESGVAYLMFRNPYYRGYFFPAQRLATDTSLECAAVALVREETGLGIGHSVRVGGTEYVADVHDSPRFQRRRGYLFHICEIVLPGIDSAQSDNALDLALTQTGRMYRWFSEAELLAGRHADLSPTVGAVLDSVLRVAQRRSVAAAAVIEVPETSSRWLARWNEHWECYHLVSGHKRHGESFDECMRRTLAKELPRGLQEGADYQIAVSPCNPIDFAAWSEWAQQERHYTMGLFPVELTAPARAAIDADPHYRWLTEAEIRAGKCRDGKAVSPTMIRLLFES